MRSATTLMAPRDVVPVRDVTGQDEQLSSAAKVARLLHAFPRDGHPMSGSDLARAAGLPKSTAHRLIRELEHEGLIERDGTRWALSWHVVELGMVAMRHQAEGLVTIARPWLVEAAALGARSVVHLSVAQGDEVVVLDKVLTAKAPRIPTEPGLRLAGRTTAAGRALGLQRDPAPTSAAQRPGANRDRARSWATVSRWGVSVDCGETFEGIGCVAAPISVNRRAVAAVSISGPVDELDVRAHVQLVTWVARRLSDDLHRAHDRQAL